MNQGQPQPPLVAAMRTQGRIIGALILREMHTRFGRENIGYLWLFVEPSLLGGAIATLHHFQGQALPGGANVFTFWIVGYVPYYMFRAIINRAPNTIMANRTLLFHRNITSFNLAVSRSLLEGAAAFGATAIFLFAFSAITGDWPDEPALVVLGMVLLLLFSHGLALMLTAASIYTDFVDRVIHIVSYLSLPLTGAFVMVYWLPYEWQAAFLLNPTVHCFEMLRQGLFGAALPVTYDTWYVIQCMVAANALGLFLLRRANRRLEV